MRKRDILVFAGGIALAACGDDASVGEAGGSGGVVTHGGASGGAPATGGVAAAASGGGSTGGAAGGAPSAVAGAGGTAGAGGAGGTAEAVGAAGNHSMAGAAAAPSAGAPPIGGATIGGAAGSGAAGAPDAAGVPGTSGMSGTGGVAGAGGEAGSGGAEPFPDLRITSDTESIEFTPVLVAAESYYPGEARVGSGGIVSLLDDDSVDLGSNAETQALRQSVDHPNLRIIFTVTETFYRIIARRSAGVEELADLEGKTVATFPNTSSAFYLDKMLRTVGLTDQDVTVRAGFGSSLADMIVDGEVAAITLWEPTPQIAMDRLGDDAIEFQDRSVYREIVNLHSTAEKLADPVKRRGIVQFVRSLVEAQREFREHPEQVKPRVAEALELEPELLDKVWHNEQWQGTLVPDILDVLEEEEVWVARERDRTPRTREELATIVDDSVFREALGLP